MDIYYTSKPVEGSQSEVETRRLNAQGQNFPSVFQVLEFVKRSFDQDDFLDDVPLDAAGNAGAWKAWRAHRASSGAYMKDSAHAQSPDDVQDEWKWDGVWEQRVHRGIDASVSDSVLYGSANFQDLVNP